MSSRRIRIIRTNPGIFCGGGAKAEDKGSEQALSIALTGAPSCGGDRSARHVRSIQLSLNDGQGTALDLAVDASEVLTDDAQEQRIETEGAENKDDDCREAGWPLFSKNNPTNAVGYDPPEK